MVKPLALLVHPCHRIHLAGGYAMMFGFYLYILRTRAVANGRFLTMATISLFLLSTTHCALLLASTTYVNMALASEIQVYSLNASEIDSMEALVNRDASLNRAANARAAIYVTSKSVHILPLGLGLITDTDDTEVC
jgi:hypothetical protein